MDDIKDQIENKIYWIRIDEKKMKLLLKGHSKRETKKDLVRLISNQTNLNNAEIYRLIINFHDDMKKFNWGVISINIDNYKVVNNNLKKYNLEGKYGRIWFEKEWLLENGWNNKYIANVINLLRKNKGKILIPGINIYEFFGK